MSANPFAELSPPYATIVADPPWEVRRPRGWGVSGNRSQPYSTMTLGEIADLPVAELCSDYSHVYLWTVNRFVRDAYDIVDAWGLTPSALLTWCKPVHGRLLGREFTPTSEFVLFAKRGKGSAGPIPHRVDRSWFEWPRGAQSVKPPAFFDLVERVSPGPYVELFARQPRLGWDSWGYGYEGAA